MRPKYGNLGYTWSAINKSLSSPAANPSFSVGIGIDSVPPAATVWGKQPSERLPRPRSGRRAYMARTDTVAPLRRLSGSIAMERSGSRTGSRRCLAFQHSGPRPADPARHALNYQANCGSGSTTKLAGIPAAPQEPEVERIRCPSRMAVTSFFSEGDAWPTEMMPPRA